MSRASPGLGAASAELAPRRSAPDRPIARSVRAQDGSRSAEAGTRQAGARVATTRSAGALLPGARRFADHGLQDRRQIGPVSCAPMPREAAIREVVRAVEDREARVFAFCNMHTFNLARRLPALAGALSRATVFNDGIGVDLASRLIHGKAFPANLNGTDLTPAVLAGLQSPIRVCLVGSRPEVVTRAAAVLEARYPCIQVVNVHDGFFDATEGERLIDTLARIDPDLVLVGMGNPRQELWAINAATRVAATFLCVGAFLDFTSGSIQRAPGMVRRLRGEWLYRLAQEPRRLGGRYLIGGPRFMVDILRTWRAMRAQRLAMDAAATMDRAAPIDAAATMEGAPTIDAAARLDAAAPIGRSDSPESPWSAGGPRSRR